MGKKNDITKWIKREAAKLPEETYIAFPKELIYEEETKDKDGKLVKRRLETPMYKREMVEYPVSHQRRIRKLYNKTKSLILVEAYFLTRGFKFFKQ